MTLLRKSARLVLETEERSTKPSSYVRALYVLVLFATAYVSGPLLLWGTSAATPTSGTGIGHRDTPRILGSPYYSVEANRKATLMLSNQGPHEMPVTVSLFSASGEQFQAPSFLLSGNAVQSFDLDDWIGHAGPAFREGSLQVSFSGKRLELGGLLTLLDEGHSLVFEQELMEAAKDFRSSILEGVWWLPSDHCAVQFVIINASDSPVTSELSVDQQAPVQLNLKSHETRVLKLRDAFSKTAQIPKIGGISLQHNGLPGAVFAVGLVQEPSTGYSNVIEFTDPQTVRATRLDGAGLRIGLLAGEELTQYAVVRNIGRTPTIVKGQIPYTLTGGGTGSVVLPDAYLRPGEVKEIPLHELIERLPNRLSIAAAGLEFSYNTAPGTVIASAVSLSPSGSQVFRLPLKDPNVQSSSTGNYPWSIDQDSSTTVYVKNTTATPKRFTMHIRFDGGTYVFGAKNIEANQTLAFDLKQLRDDHVPDSLGNVMFSTARSGQVHWSVQGSESKALIGRAEQSNIAGGLSTTSSCGVCCPDSFNTAFLTPDSLTGIAGDLAQLESYEIDTDCYGSNYDPYPRDPSWNTWSCDNTSVAAIDETGTATAQGYGNTYLHGSFFATRYSPTAGDECTSTDLTADSTTSCDVYDPPPAPAITCSIQIKGSGNKSPGDNLRFDSGDETLGPKNFSDRWVQQVELGGTVSDDVANWTIHQKYSGLKTLNGHTSPLSVPNDDPQSFFVQKPVGQTNYFWLDGPGSYKSGVQNLTQVQNFTSWIQNGTYICRKTWHLKLVVTNGTLTQQSYGEGFISTR